MHRLAIKPRYMLRTRTNSNSMEWNQICANIMQTEIFKKILNKMKNTTEWSKNIYIYKKYLKSKVVF